MKKMLWGLFTLAVLSVSLLSTGCSKPKDGKDGAQGPAGTANVMYSPWMSVTFTFSNTDSVYEANINAPKLVDSILQKGEVKVFLNFGTSATPDIVPLPYFDGSAIINVEFSATNIFMYSNANPSTQTSGGTTTRQYRYVIIPGGAATGRQATINWNDYSQVKQYLGLKD